MNSEIRADKKNVFRLRTLMRLCDKQMVIDALDTECKNDAIIFQRKLLREPIYDKIFNPEITGKTQQNNYGFQ